MNNAHLHLVVNHLPIIFPIVGIVILLVSFYTKNEVVKRTSFFVFVLGALASVFAMATGEGAEEAVEHLPGITENLIHKHEEAAEVFAALSYVLGVISLAGIYASWKNLSFSKFLPFVIGGVSLISLFFAQQAGSSGGEIRHTEIRTESILKNFENGGEEGEKSEAEEQKNVENKNAEESGEAKEKGENQKNEKDDDDDDD